MWKFGTNRVMITVPTTAAMFASYCEISTGMSCTATSFTTRCTGTERIFFDQNGGTYSSDTFQVTRIIFGSSFRMYRQIFDGFNDMDWENFQNVQIWKKN